MAVLAMEETHSTTTPSCATGVNTTVNFTEVSDYLQSKYAQFHADLLACYQFLEQENAKLLQIIRENQRQNSPPRRIEKLLNEFSFKIATAKDVHERQTIEEGSVEGRQAFLAKRWKGRYYALLELTECYLNLLKMRSVFEKEVSKSNEKASELKRLNEFILNIEGIVGPWIVDKNNAKTDSDVPLKDLSCGEPVFSKACSYSEYAANDLVVPLSSVFLVDVLSNHKLCTQNIKQFLELKPQILHVFHKEKERRDQLKRQCGHLKDELNALRRHYAAACMQLKNLGSTQDDDTQTAISVAELAVRGEEEGEKADEEEEGSQMEADEVTERTPGAQKLAKDKKKLSGQIRELQSALKEEEIQLALVMKRLQRVTGTVHAFVRLLNGKQEASHIQLISHNKLLVDFKDCFILDGIRKAEDGNGALYGDLSGLVLDCLHDGPVTIVTLGPSAEDLLLSPTEGLALLEVGHLIGHFETLAETEFYLYAFAISCTNNCMIDLIEEHPAAEPIICDHADPDFMGRSKCCVRIENADGFVSFLRWLNENKDTSGRGQVALFLRLVGQDRIQKTLTHTSWLCFYPLFSSVERDAMAGLFQALQKRARPNAAETSFTQMIQKSLIGRTRTIIVLNLDFDFEQTSETIANLTFANDAVKATTESADQLVAKFVPHV
ncbi:kinesin family member c1 [Echinococcus multilocularis]|uniref:Kinesin family member c1 n=1 Tax=Echinococcus multilocularis TaxID=6211 RepID=A0A068XXY4_ECHMU|nr:kinesin family member c1 [Echinococcus multilocularis]